jgi:hypothetical protein
VAVFIDELLQRIVGNGGSLQRNRPMRFETLFVYFSQIETDEGILKFVERHGPLTLNGLRGKGDDVLKLINEAKDMRSRVSKPLKLNAMVLYTGGETQLRVTPACLLDAIWLQYAQANAHSLECRNPRCRKRFLVGAAADRRADTVYCSNECRVKFNSLKRSLR